MSLLRGESMKGQSAPQMTTRRSHPDDGIRFGRSGADRLVLLIIAVSIGYVLPSILHARPASSITSQHVLWVLAIVAWLIMNIALGYYVYRRLTRGDGGSDDSADRPE